MYYFMVQRYAFFLTFPNFLAIFFEEKCGFFIVVRIQILSVSDDGHLETFILGQLDHVGSTA